MPKTKSLTQTLKSLKKVSESQKDDLKIEIEKLQLKMLKIQHGIYHDKKRVIIVFEGFDAAGKGGAIRTLTENLDPRGFRVHPIGAPHAEEQAKHWLYRFWTNLPAPGRIAIFDRSWYGRVLVERVDKLIPKEKWLAAYEEINQFEKVLQDDGIIIIKIFLAITKEEQLGRFEDRLKDPYKQWKIGPDDIKARKKWDQYVTAVDDIFTQTDTRDCPWNVIEANSKKQARQQSLSVITSRLKFCEDWMDEKALQTKKKNLTAVLKDLKL